MANSYLHEVSDLGYPLPGEYAEPSYRGWTKEDEAETTAEFVAFLRHWRERVLQALEEQNRPDGETRVC
ncbi:MAG: hypothetical protein GXY44_08765 [Phycisphaerales bacterium]|nr:hypothetical protein [Phycisphaerales bacterium]